MTEVIEIIEEIDIDEFDDNDITNIIAPLEDIPQKIDDLNSIVNVFSYNNINCNTVFKIIVTKLLMPCCKGNPTEE